MADYGVKIFGISFVAVLVCLGILHEYNMQIAFYKNQLQLTVDDLVMAALNVNSVLDTNHNSEETTTEVSEMHPHRQRISNAIRQKYSAFRKTAVEDKMVDITQNRHKITDYHNEPSEALYESPPTVEDERLNIVLLYADDWTLKVLGKLNPHVQTPNVDKLADEGMLFPYNCVTTSICWISRGTLATGTYAAVHRHVKIADDHLFTNQHFEWKDTLYPLLKQNGYYSGHVGKWHGPLPREHAKSTFDVMNNYYGSHWLNRNGKRRHVTDLNGEDALNFLKHRPRDKPFHLTVAFFATHAQDGHHPPYNPMNESKALYTDGDIPEVRTNTEEHWKALPWFFERRNEGRKRWVRRFDTPENYQANVKDLFRMATEVDSVVGAIVDTLKEQGVYEKTLIVFTTDNGNLHGEHGMAEKWYPFEESIRVPLVIRDPRMPESQRGQTNNEFTLSVDLAPTLLRAAKIDVPDFMQGRDIAELYRHPEQAIPSWRKDFFYEWTQGEPINAVGHNVYYHIPAVFALIRRDWKYFYWPQVGYEQLFHIERDPDEEFDVLNATISTTKEALAYMRARYAFLKNYSQSGNPV